MNQFSPYSDRQRGAFNHAQQRSRFYGQNQLYNYNHRAFFMQLRERQWWQQSHYYNMKRYARMLHEQQHMERMHP